MNRKGPSSLGSQHLAQGGETMGKVVSPGEARNSAAEEGSSRLQDLGAARVHGKDL